MKAEFHILRIFFGNNAERGSDVGWVAKEFTRTLTSPNKNSLFVHVLAIL